MTKSGDEGQQFCLHHVKFELPVKTSKQRHGVGISSPKITLDNISPSLRERSEEALASWIIKRKETLAALLFLCHVLPSIYNHNCLPRKGGQMCSPSLSEVDRIASNNPIQEDFKKKIPI